MDVERNDEGRLVEPVAPQPLVDRGAVTDHPAEEEAEPLAGDWLAFRIPDSSDGSAESDCARRIEIRFGRPDAAVSPFAPPCRVEWSSDPSAGASSVWHLLGDVAPATELFVADLPAAPVAAIRVVVTADSSAPLVVREAGFSDPEAECPLPLFSIVECDAFS